MDAFLQQLAELYGEARVAVRKLADRWLIKVLGVRLANGTMVDVLVDLVTTFRSAGGRPPVYVSERATQPNGRRGRNVNPTLVHGEPWLGFSWQFDWSPADPAWVLVEGAVRRFSVNED